MVKITATAVNRYRRYDITIRKEVLMEMNKLMILMLIKISLKILLMDFDSLSFTAFSFNEKVRVDFKLNPWCL